MLDKKILERALEIETKECEKEKDRAKEVFGHESEIVFVPVIVKENDGRIGSLTYSDLMKTYNKLVREEEND